MSANLFISVFNKLKMIAKLEDINFCNKYKLEAIKNYHLNDFDEELEEKFIKNARNLCNIKKVRNGASDKWFLELPCVVKNEILKYCDHASLIELALIFEEDFNLFFHPKY
jgi:hypothetical protein